MTHTFKIGDVVRLGDIPSPCMRVVGISEQSKIICFWFNRRQEPESVAFRPELLTKTTPYVHRPREPRADAESAYEPKFMMIEAVDAAD